jgi:hypothetical protein
MTLSPSELRHHVRGVIVEASGADPLDRAQLGVVFSSLSERLRKALRPLFGGAAVNALSARALHLATSEFPWLPEVLDKNGEIFSAGAIVKIQNVDLDIVANGLAAVLARNVELLCTFVGEDLVLPIVRVAWSTALLDRHQRDQR